MAAQEQEIILKYLNKIRTDIIDDLHSKGISKGDLGLKVNASDNTVTSYDYLYFLVHGRKPGKQPPTESILAWIQKKVLQPEGKITFEQLAFLIARKIGKMGTDIYQGKRPGVALEEIIKDNQIMLSKDITKYYKDTIKKLFDDKIKPAFNSLN